MLAADGSRICTRVWTCVFVYNVGTDFNNFNNLLLTNIHRLTENYIRSGRKSKICLLEKRSYSYGIRFDRCHQPTIFGRFYLILSSSNLALHSCNCLTWFKPVIFCCGSLVDIGLFFCIQCIFFFYTNLIKMLLRIFLNASSSCLLYTSRCV